MSLPLEDYALIGDCQTAGLISRDGSLDWLCWPRFDWPASFAALLGGPEYGRWRLSPTASPQGIRREYGAGSLILETRVVTRAGEVGITDFMTTGDQPRCLVRIVEGLTGRVEMRSEFRPVGDFGASRARLFPAEHGIRAFDGLLDYLLVASSEDLPYRLETVIENSQAVTTFAVGAGERVSFALGEAIHEQWPLSLNPKTALEETKRFWARWWASGGSHRRRPEVARSLLVLKSLAHPLGGTVAAPTTSLPQSLGGVRNWDYRYCWLRDSALIVSVLARSGFLEEGRAWRTWLLHVMPEDLRQIQSVYGLGGEKRLDETELGWLPGYAGSRPVRVGNAAYVQSQLDALGWVMMALSDLRRADDSAAASSWRLERALADHVAAVWDRPDHGVWEVRGEPQHFTDSKVMAWTALDRAIDSAERWSLEAPLEQWRSVRDAIHRQVCTRAYNAGLGTFVQSYGSELLDSNLLTMPLTGFLPIGDERVARTIDSVQRTLMKDGFLMRYDPRVDDGLPPGQGAFLPCTFWLVECLALASRFDEAAALFQRAAGVANDVGLLSEQYDTGARRLTGNFPQGFTHAALVSAALRL